jgi:hypothetical protein
MVRILVFLINYSALGRMFFQHLFISAMLLDNVSIQSVEEYLGPFLNVIKQRRVN